MPTLEKNAHIETKQEKTDRENRETCRRIALELEAYVGGSVRRCPKCGEIINRTEWDDVGDKFKCTECGAVVDADDLEPLSVWDYMEDVLDIEYRTTGRNADDLRSVSVMVTCGGPNIYIDTASASVELYWWGDRASYPISYDARDAVDEWAAEMWGCM